MIYNTLLVKETETCIIVHFILNRSAYIKADVVSMSRACHEVKHIVVRHLSRVKGVSLNTI